jgi:hypothetical protein
VVLVVVTPARFEMFVGFAEELAFKVAVSRSIAQNITATTYRVTFTSRHLVHFTISAVTLDDYYISATVPREICNNPTNAMARSCTTDLALLAEEYVRLALWVRLRHSKAHRLAVYVDEHRVHLRCDNTKSYSTGIREYDKVCVRCNSFGLAVQAAMWRSSFSRAIMIGHAKPKKRKNEAVVRS